MPNIGTVLKKEISRLSRREVRRHVETTRKATAQHRRHIAELKRQVANLERQVSLLERRVLSVPQAGPAGPTAPRVRFVAKGLRSQRERLGLSAADYGRLVGVSAQSIYNWERELAKPREAQLATLATLRRIGRRQAQSHLDQLGAKGGKRRGKT
jgi:DNA-binding XRE family transcriptional regulator